MRARRNVADAVVCPRPLVNANAIVREMRAFRAREGQRGRRISDTECAQSEAVVRWTQGPLTRRVTDPWVRGEPHATVVRGESHATLIVRSVERSARTRV
jgi:hypothetical protein